MTDQWFLDLDGVRSGPYQTSEVMGLIADGEVFPHHRIARSLKDTQWQTILDWRLEQARQVQTKRITPSNAPDTAAQASVPKVETSPAPEILVGEAPVEAKTDLMESPKIEPSSEPESDSLPPPIQTFAPGQEEFLKEIESMEKAMAELPSSGSKRDPMAEMFDILQNTKQKREAKQLQSAQQASEEEKLNREKPLVSKRFLLIVGAAAIVGLSIGQVLQLIWPPPAPTTVKDSKSEPKAEPTEETQTEVVDRSNDKMTIRAVVEKKQEPTPAKAAAVRSKPIATPNPTPVPVEPTPEEVAETTPGEKKNTDKELEELRDLKKELQELKALKEELKNAPLSDEFNEGDLGPYPDNAGGSFGGTNGGSAYPSVMPEGSEPASPAAPKGSPGQEEYRY